MAGHLNDPSPSGPKKNGVKKRQARGATFTVRSNNRGQFFRHPQKGQVEVIALYCDCGRAVLVTPRELKSKAILCTACNSAFRWQQLSLGMD